MMDFADDFTYFGVDEILAEARRLYRHNRYIETITLDSVQGGAPQLVFRLKAPCALSLRQMGLPVKFRSFDTRLQAANQG